ncbi:MAG: outer membrane beta-barrel protein [Gammaproteobacteria bacterium]|nr:outer membrane beta-barrel protein [Gammaproteobacteria bacterium]
MRAFLTALLLCAAFTTAADDSPRPYGSLFRAVAGERLEREHGIAVIGFGHVTLSEANHDIPASRMPQGRARNTQPQSGVAQDEGLNLQHVGLIVCKGDACPPGRIAAPTRNLLSRIGPLPGPRGDQVKVDWALSALVGEDGVFWKTKGFDDWSWNADDAHRLAFTQWYLDLYLPIGGGTTVLLGSWHNPLAAEIGYTFTPPNYFASRSYAFAVGPAKNVGALIETRLPLAPAFGLASAFFGITGDWNALDFGSGSGGPTFMFGARWRSPDMRTWLDLETIYGNGEDDFGDVRVKNGIPRPRGGGSQYLALSSTDAYLDRFVGYVTLNHAVSERLDLVAEGVYGFQEGGDLAPLPFAITQDASFYGLNVGFRYRLLPGLYTGARVEAFVDEEAANVLWGGVGAGGGAVYAATLNVSWEALPWVIVRPELKYDAYDGDGHLFAPDRNGIAQHDSQLLGVMNFEFRF